MITSLLNAYLKTPRHRGKARLARLLLCTFRPRAVRSYYGPFLRCRPDDKTFIYAVSGDYGDVVRNHIDSIGGNDVFIDIGANYGLFSLYAAQQKPHASIVAFEPNPAIYGCLLENILLNNVANIIPFHLAVGPEDVLVNLGYTPDHSGRSAVGGKAAQHFIVSQFDISKWAVLNDLCKNRDVHIKIDVEGYEPQIIKCLLKAPWFSRIKTIIMEVDGAYLIQHESSAPALYEMMEKAGLKADHAPASDQHIDEIFRRRDTV